MKGLGCCSRDTGHRREPAPPHKIVGISVVVMLIYPFLYCRLEVISRSLVAPRSQLSGAHYMQQRHDPHSIFPNVLTILNVCAYSIIYSGLARYIASISRLAKYNRKHMSMIDLNTHTTSAPKTPHCLNNGRGYRRERMSTNI